MPGGDLGERLKGSGRLPEATVRSLTAELVLAIDFLHKNGSFLFT
jgi:serine/threonine protein kinase